LQFQDKKLLTLSCFKRSVTWKYAPRCLHIVVICYLASPVNCDRALEQSRLIATATVTGCSERSHFYLLADRCAPFLNRCRCIHAACFFLRIWFECN